MNAIIFGITGQDGSHLADLLLEKNYKVIGVTRRSSTKNTQRINHLLSNEKFELIEGDITDSNSLLHILRNTAHVDEIYNLAAQSHVGTSFSQPSLTFDVTGKGCLNILQTIVNLKMNNVKFYQASSSEMFGKSFDIDRNGVKYQDENTKFLPQSPYAIAKCAAHYSVRLYREAYGIHASSGILFNHEGPRRGDQFVTKKIVNWVVDLMFLYQNGTAYIDETKFDFTDSHIIYENNSIPKLMLGNLDAYRDWGYAGDYVEAMWLMLQQDKPDDYVICTEETHSIRDLLDAAFGYCGISDWSNFVGIDPQFCRPSEVDYLCGRSTKARTKLGWSPKYDFKSLVHLMMKEGKYDKLQNYDRHIEHL
jgi:GDPmannose 4,6-dehydratase